MQVHGKNAHLLQGAPIKQFRGAPSRHAKIAKMDIMQCPRCKSLRIQIGYKDRSILARLAGVDEFLCNNCGLEFRSFDSSGKVQRVPATETESPPNRRRAPRYKAHLPAAIRLAKKNNLTGKLILSKASRGHCVTISKLGLALSFIGSRFRAEDFVHTGRLLFVTITLPNGPIDAVVTTVTHDRVGEGGTARWLVRASITQMSDGDTARLLSYLDKRGNEAPLFTLE
jgi:hypothetical protein